VDFVTLKPVLSKHERETAMSNFDSTKTRLAALLQDIEKGKIQLPDFQRGWVWDDDHIRSLLVSIARAFPIGAVMLLESGGEVRFQVRPIEGIDPLVATPGMVEKLILDGQQRLTSLSQVLLLTKPVKTTDDKKRPIERYYYIDIDTALDGAEHYEDAVFGVEADRKVKTNFGRDVKLDLSSEQKEYENFCFPCNQILNSDQWEEGLLNAVDQDKFRRYMKFRQNVLAEFRNYDVPIIELKKNNKKEAVCLVFEKVNTGGVPLSVFELLTATYAADGAAGVNLRKEWFGEQNGKSEGTVQRLAKQRLLRGIEATEFLQGLSLLHTFDCRKKDLAQGKVGKQATGVSAKREAVLALPLAAYKQWKEPLEKGFWQAAKFLRRESFFSPNDLPYRTQLVPLGAVLALLGERWLEKRICEGLSRWFWCGILGELYGGAVESRMALDVQELMAWLDGGEAEPTTVRDASFQPGRLDTLRSRLSAAYKGINVLIQRNGAQDFFWKSTIRDLDETDWEECKLDIHHIFPRAWCDKQATPIPPKRYNSILNKTPISYKANRMIGGRPPSEYLKQLQTHKNVKLDDASMDRILATHYIDPAQLRANNYEQFIEQRRSALISLITQVMGKPVVTTGEGVAEDEIDEEDAAPATVSPASSLELAAPDGAASTKTNSAGGRQKGKWPNWDAALAAVANPAIVTLFREELAASRENYLPRRSVRYRVIDKRRWIVRARPRYAYVWQEGRFDGDDAYWRSALSQPNQVKAVAGDKALRFHLSTEGDVKFFRQAVKDKAGVQWTDGSIGLEAGVDDDGPVERPRT
jgi:hypothetical protein